MPDLLLEIGCEEIPARMIDAASAELRDKVLGLLQRERLAPAAEAVAFSTPRRLALLLAQVPATQPDLSEQVLGPSLKVGYKDGVATPAAQAFAKKVGVDVAQLEKTSTSKGEYIAATVTRRGRSASEILAESLPKEVSSIYWPKSMYWREGSRETFVRPVRWLVALLDQDVIPLNIDGIHAGNVSRGHRILSRGHFLIPAAAAYVDTLREAKVLGREEREHRIRKALDACTRTIPGARWREDKELLDTVVNLTEFPSVILGSFDREYLELAEEVLVTVMRDHQKYFAVEDAAGKLAPYFLAVLNTDSDREGLIRHGNERVLRARFNDARFFWQIDQKRPLRERVEMLKSVTFQKDLGSYYDKTLRVQRLASQVCEILKENAVSVRPGIVHKAALLAKTDLTTELVKEFTELQGIVGGLYARAQQLDPHMADEARNEISIAIYDHYRPESMEDTVPRSVEGAVLSVCDKADSIAGMFALGLIPSGSKDPFALRRQANGIIKILAEHKLPLSLGCLFGDARGGYRDSAAEARFSGKVNYAEAVQGFIRERLEFYLRDVRGYAYDVVNAVLAAGADDVVDAQARAEAVATVRGSEDFEHLAAAFKRIKNILRQAGEKGISVPDRIDRERLAEDEEIRLHAAIANVAAEVSHAATQAEAIRTMSRLRPAVDAFFDKVMVMVEDQKVRDNRLALLRSLLNEFSTIADFSEIVTEKK